MSERIVLLNTWHNSLDDRVFYHQAKSLSKFGYDVRIISTKDNTTEEHDMISIRSFYGHQLTRKDKINKIVENLSLFSPDKIICDSPIAVFASAKFRKTHPVKIIYDITEWYPSKIHLQHYKGFRKVIGFMMLLMGNFSAGIKSDSFIFGEYYKSIIFRLIFFWRKHIILPYYPDINFIQYYPLEKITTEINLLYTGKINTDKGIDAVVGAIQEASLLCREIQFRLKIIGNFPTQDDRLHFNRLVSDLPGNVTITLIDSLPYPEFCNTIGNTHLFFDLRKIDVENTHCLPIKLFYYLACGRPVIYSNLKSIRQEIKDINFGHLCDPDDIQTIAGHIVDYITQPAFYSNHATNALTVSKSTYNWNAIENDFISFIQG